MIWHHPEIAGRTYDSPFSMAVHWGVVSGDLDHALWVEELMREHYGPIRHCRIGKITIKDRR